MELVLDNYRGGEVKEIKVNNRKEYEMAVSEYLMEDPDNLVTVRGKKSYTIELSTNEIYGVFEVTNPANRVFLELDLAMVFIWENVNKN